MPTVRGAAVAVIGLALIALGRLLGTDGLAEVGFGLVVLVAAALVVVRFGRHDLEVTRRVRPERVPARQAVRVYLQLRNAGNGRAPVLLLEDGVPGGLAGRPRFTLMGLEPGGEREVSYELRPARRGRYELGPLRITYTDPFGLAKARERRGGRSALLVHPRVHRLTAPTEVGHYRSPAVTALRQLSGGRGDDFYTLREYVDGDDLRKVHWPSTAKRGLYMIRQEETPWQARATVVLDDRAAAHHGAGDGGTFERAVEACASLADLYARSGYSFRLLTSAGEALPAARGHDHFRRWLDLLAEIRPHAGDGFAATLGRLQLGPGAEGILAVVTPDLGPEVAAGLGGCRRRFRDVLLVSLAYGDPGGAAAVRAIARSGVTPVVLGPSDDIARAWRASPAGSPGRREGSWGQRPARV